MTDASPDGDDFKKLCAKRRMNGFVLLALGGFFGFVASLVAKQSSSPEEAQGAYAVPVIIFAIGFYYLLIKPKTTNK